MIFPSIRSLGERNDVQNRPWPCHHSALHLITRPLVLVDLITLQYLHAASDFFFSFFSDLLPSPVLRLGEAEILRTQKESIFTKSVWLAG